MKIKKKIRLLGDTELHCATCCIQLFMTQFVTTFRSVVVEKCVKERLNIWFVWTIFTSIHRSIFYTCLLLHWGSWGSARAYPSFHGAGYTLDKLPVQQYLQVILIIFPCRNKIAWQYIFTKKNIDYCYMNFYCLTAQIRKVEVKISWMDVDRKGTSGFCCVLSFVCLIFVSQLFIFLGFIIDFYTRFKNTQYITMFTQHVSHWHNQISCTHTKYSCLALTSHILIVSSVWFILLWYDFNAAFM